MSSHSMSRGNEINKFEGNKKYKTNKQKEITWKTLILIVTLELIWNARRVVFLFLFLWFNSLFFLILSLFYSLFFAFSILCVCFNLFFLFDILLLRSFDRMLSSASRRNRVALECGWQVEYRQSIVATEMTCGIVSLIFLILANNKKEFSFFCFPNLLSTMEFEIFEFHRSRVTGRPAGTGSC